MPRRKLRELVGRIATQGITPHKLALTLALGVAVGILPLLWGSTLLCALLAFAFGLNQAGIQAVNYLSYPLQLALLVPFYRLGAKLFPFAASFACSSVKGGGLAVATLKALGAWLLIAPPTAVLLYLIVLTLLTRTRFAYTILRGASREQT
jgi:uncharacterized protein (DUF2062 family)